MTPAIALPPTTMNTVTIQSPTEALALVTAAFPKRLYNSACYEASDDGDRWKLAHSSSEPGTYGWFGYGATPEEALADLKAKVATYDPLKEARAKLEAAGFSVVAPD